MMWYRIKTAFQGLSRLVALHEEDKQACIDAVRSTKGKEEKERY